MIEFTFSDRKAVCNTVHGPLRSFQYFEALLVTRHFYPVEWNVLHSCIAQYKLRLRTAKMAIYILGV
jgi:hypothetical protein